jgi:hypothetical protein
MTPEERKVFEGFLSKTLNIDSEGVAALFNEAGELTNVEPLLEANAKKVSLNKEIAENQYKRGQKEALAKHEKDLKTTYAVDSDKQGSELVAEILAKETEAIKAATNLKPEDIDKHPRVIELRREYEKQVSQKEAEWSQKLTSEVENLRYENIKATINGIAKEALPANKFDLPKDEARRKKLLDVYLSEIHQNHKFAPTEDGKDFNVLDLEGKPAYDAQGKLLKLSDVIVNTGKTYFDIQTAESRSNAGNNGGKPTPNIAVADFDDYKKQMREAGDDKAKRAALTSTWEQKQK